MPTLRPSPTRVRMHSRRGRLQTIRVPPAHTDLRACGQVLSYSRFTSITEVHKDRTGQPGAQLACLRFGLKKFSKLKGAFLRPLRTGAAADPGPMSAFASTSATVPTSPFAGLAWPNARDVRCVSRWMGIGVDVVLCKEWSPRAVLVLGDHRAPRATSALAGSGLAGDLR